MAGNVLEIILRAKDDATSTIGVVSKGVDKAAKEAAKAAREAEREAQKAVSGVSKVAQIIKSLLTGNVTEASRALSEMGGEWASVAASGAVAAVAITAWVTVVKKLIALSFAKHIYEIQSAIAALTSSAERMNVVFDRQESVLKRTKEAGDAYRKTQEAVRGARNEIAINRTEGVRAAMLTGENDPVRIAQINAQADKVLAEQKIKNERAVLGEKIIAHNAEVKAINDENKLLADQSDKRMAKIAEAVAMQQKMAAEIEKNSIGVGGLGWESKGNEQRLAEQEKAAGIQTKLQEEQEADNKKRLDNDAALNKLKIGSEIFSVERDRINSLAHKEFSAQEKTQAEITALVEKESKKRAAAELDAQKKGAQGAVQEADANMADVNAIAGTAARDRMKAEAQALRDEAAKGFTKSDVETRMTEDRAETLRKRETASMDRKVQSYQAQLELKGGDMTKLPKFMQAAIKLENERKDKENQAKAKEAAALAAQKKFEAAAQAQIDAKASLANIEKSISDALVVGE